MGVTSKREPGGAAEHEGQKQRAARTKRLNDGTAQED
jgi:hypothetical protein